MFPFLKKQKTEEEREEKERKKREKREKKRKRGEEHQNRLTNDELNRLDEVRLSLKKSSSSGYRDENAFKDDKDGPSDNSSTTSSLHR